MGDEVAGTKIAASSKASSRGRLSTGPMRPAMTGATLVTRLSQGR